METVKWGGPFMGMDREAKKPVRGMMFGHFEGTVPAAATEALKAKIMQSINDGLAGHRGSLTSLLEDKQALGEVIFAALEPSLAELGVSGELRVDGVK